MNDAKIKILVIDDEEAIRSILRLSLSPQEFEVAESASGRAGLVWAAEFHPHLVILDLGLPDINGLDFLKELRRWTMVPVIVLTVNDEETVKVALLDGGADDYLTKPFGTSELLARIRVSLRHHDRVEATPIFVSDDLRVDLNKRLVEVSGESIKLTATEFDILCILIRSNGKVVPQSQLLSSVWGRVAVDQPHYLRIYIGQLRKKLEEDPSAPVHILTEPGIGYRIR
jgi:two-component system KDP operon response regulator KdpE